jgi:hypothetical protein
MGLNVEHTYLECDCNCTEHTLRFTRYFGLDDFDRYLEVDIYLVHYMSFLRRAWHGIRYIFGYKCKYGAFDNVLLNKKSVEKLRDLCTEHLKALNLAKDPEHIHPPT